MSEVDYTSRFSSNLPRANDWHLHLAQDFYHPSSFKNAPCIIIGNNNWHSLEVYEKVKLYSNHVHYVSNLTQARQLKEFHSFALILLDYELADKYLEKLKHKDFFIVLIGPATHYLSLYQLLDNFGCVYDCLTLPIQQRVLESRLSSYFHQRKQEFVMSSIYEDIAYNLNTLTDSCCLFDSTQMLVAANKAAQNVYPFLTKENLNALHILPHFIPKKLFEDFCQDTRKKNFTVMEEDCNYSLFRTHDGSALLITQNLTPLSNLTYLAYHDALTGIGNRELFYKTLYHVIHTIPKAAVAFLDIDDFKKVNDTYGHSSGDALLAEVAKRLKESLRNKDAIARLGGDEFGIILTNLESWDTLPSVIQRMIDSLSLPYQIDNKKISITVSIGVAAYPKDAKTTKALIQRADEAMYHVKKKNKNAFFIYGEADK